ncbi:MAG TPA: pilus assembly protein PilM [Phycisphaerae bacterium]|nr:pilus assembly protein PilM [Phycisphaerales bacterium]HRX83811.1 pilus assembly protein PilM [Phycisphaerae bacterium]
MAVLLDRLKVRAKAVSAALDVGQTALRVAQIKRDGARWVVTTAGTCRRRSPERGGDEALFAARVARWLNQLGLQRRDIVAGLSPPDVELHAINLSNSDASADAESPGEAVRAELERLTSFDSTSAETDYWRLPESPALRSQVVGVAARRDGIASALALCEAAGLDCHRIDATPCALARFGTMYRGHSATEEDVWSVLDMGGRMSRIIVCAGGTPILARAFVYGGRAWTDKLAQSLAVSPQTAEQHKRDHGVAHGDAPHGTDGGSAGNVLGDLIFNVLRSDLDEMVEELERSYRYVMQCFPRRAPGPLVLVGGGAVLRGLDVFLQERLGVTVLTPGITEPEGSLLDLTACGQDSVSSASAYACAIGLAIPQESADG